MAASLLLYLLKANVALLLFALAYFGLLRRLTFFALNRAFLVFGLLFAAAYPALPVPALLPAEVARPVVFAVVETAAAVGEVAGPAGPAIDWAALGLGLYAAGAAVLLARLLGQLLSLRQLWRRSRPLLVLGQPVRALAGAVSPFSFGRTIYLNPELHAGPELTAVLRHELVHVRQWHTLDVLLAQLALAAAWCNPAAWLLARALLDNLEYLADQAVLQSGLDRRAYQYSLLRLSHGTAGPSLVSHFSLPTLKNRVAMMNTPLSSTGQLARYFVAGPLVLAVTLGFSGARAQEAGSIATTVVPTAAAAQSAGLGGETAYYVDGHRTDMKAVSKEMFQNVATIKLLKGPQVRQVFGEAEPASRVTVIVTNRYRDQADIVALDQKVDAAGALDTRFKMGPAIDPATHQLPDGIKAYIAKVYPDSRITGWFITDKDSDKAPHIRYFASFVESSGEKRKLYFNAAEQPVMLPEQTAPQPAQPATAATAPPTHLVPDGPKPSGPTPIYYIDGQRSTIDINSINPNNIASINVLKGDRASQLAGEAGAAGVLLITTKQNQNQLEVLAFNEKNGLAVAAAPEKSKAVPYLAAPALAYISKNYPQARLLGVSEVPATDGSARRYQAEIVIGRRPGYLLFDAQGNFLSESYTRTTR